MSGGHEINSAGKEPGVAKHGGDVFELNARLREVGYVSDGGFEIADGDVAHRLMLLVNFLNVTDHTLEPAEGYILNLSHALAGYTKFLSNYL